MHDKRICRAAMVLALGLSYVTSIHAQSLSTPDLRADSEVRQLAEKEERRQQTDASPDAASKGDDSTRIDDSRLQKRKVASSDISEPMAMGRSVNEMLMEELGFSQDMDLAEQQTLLRRATQTEELRLALDKVLYERQKLQEDNELDRMQKQHEKDLQAIRDSLDSRVQAVRDHYRSEFKRLEVQVAALREAAAEANESDVPFLTRITMYKDEYVGAFLLDGQVKQAMAGERLSEDLTVTSITQNGATVATADSKEIFLAPVSREHARAKLRDSARQAAGLSRLSVDYRALTVEPGPEFGWAESPRADGSGSDSPGAPSGFGGWPTSPDARMRN